MVDIGEYDDLVACIADLHTPPPGRRGAVMQELARRGAYDHTDEELLAGAKVAWRNHARCNGRMHWRSLRVCDCRAAGSASEVY